MNTKHHDPSSYPSLPEFLLLEELPWLRDVSMWSAPPTLELADDRDSFLLGGGGHCSARLGMRDRVSTMERIMAPFISSYNFAENVNFRMDAVTLSRDFYPPFTFLPAQQRIWRVRNTGVIITAERDQNFELVTVSAIHPVRQLYLRYASVKNISKETQRNIGISFEAIPDIPYPAAGHRSICYPYGQHEIMERLEELKPLDRDYSANYGTETQRFRYMVRGIMEGRARGYQDLYTHSEQLAPGESLTSVHYLTPGIWNTEASAIESAQLVRHHIEVTSVTNMFREIRSWWDDRYDQRTRFDSDNQTFKELLDNNAVLQASAEGASGGFIVVDDYTGTWLRDHNGAHRYSLDLGQHSNVRRSMDRYYGLDVTFRALYSYYASDSDPAYPLPPEPDWRSVEGFVTGDVPNFRALWYWWYFKHTGDLWYVAERFEYIKGAFLRQRLESNGYLAEYCYDETYGIGPVAEMRTGLSADNSFIALSAARKLAHFARLLGREDTKELEVIAEKIHSAIEERFWIESKGYYAMRIKPDGERDETPLSIGLLRPLWIESAAESDGHAIESALYVYKHLYSKNGFIRLIPSHDQTVTMAIGYLLSALKKMSHPDLDRVLNDALHWADPSGTYGEYLQETPKGARQCYEHLAHRNRMWESGINADAILFALTGFDPNAYERKVSFAPHLPAGWKHFDTTNLLVRDARIALYQSRDGGRRTIRIVQGSGEPLTVELQLTSASKANVLVNDTDAMAVWVKNRFDLFVTKITLYSNAGEEILITL